MKDFTTIRDITMRDYFEIKGWLKEDGLKPKRGTVGNFAQQCQVSVAYISKLLNNSFTSNKFETKTFNSVAKIVKDTTGKNLIKANRVEMQNNEITRLNIKLNQDLSKLKQENFMLRKQLEEYEELVKLCRKVVDTNGKIPKIRKSRKAKQTIDVSKQNVV